MDAAEFRSVPDLRYLDLSRNHIVRLPVDLGVRLSQLSTFNLSTNAIARLDAASFVGAEKLSVLDLSRNRIQVRATAVIAKFCNI